MGESVRRGMIGELSRLQIEDTLVALTDAHGGLERIKHMSLPVQHRFLPRFLARAFGVILPVAVVADPLADTLYDIPMTALCRTIEIDLIQMIGAEPPPQVTPVDRVLR